MAEYTGKDMYFSWIHSGGTVTFHADHRSVNLAPTIDYVETQAGSEETKTRLARMKDSSVSYEGLAQVGGTVLEDALIEGTGGTLIFGPEGTAAGKRRYTIPAFSDGANLTFPYADVTTLSVNFTGNGAVVRDVYA